MIQAVGKGVETEDRPMVDVETEGDGQVGSVSYEMEPSEVSSHSSGLRLTIVRDRWQECLPMNSTNFRCVWILLSFMLGSLQIAFNQRDREVNLLKAQLNSSKIPLTLIRINTSDAVDETLDSYNLSADQHTLTVSSESEDVAASQETVPMHRALQDIAQSATHLSCNWPLSLVG